MLRLTMRRFSRRSRRMMCLLRALRRFVTQLKGLRSITRTELAASKSMFRCCARFAATLALHAAAAVFAPSKGCRIAPTCTCVHVPPRAVRTLRSLSLAAMALWLVMPLRLISSMMGRTLAANRLAFAFRAALPRFATSAMSGLPRRFADSDAKSHRPTPRFRTIQVCPKDLRALPGHPEPAVSWHSGFRGGAHARPKTTLVDHASRRRGGGVAARGAGAAAGDAGD